MMNFKQASVICNYLSKDYARSVFELIYSYQDISASEAASRLNMHIRTVQDFLDAMYNFGILEKKEVFERKRPYFRYNLKSKKIDIAIDLDHVFLTEENDTNDFLIKERKNSDARFTVARAGEYFSALTIWNGIGRSLRERKINLTIAQGTFLYYLPFPDAQPLSIDEIIKNSGVEVSYKDEILNIVQELVNLKIIEKF